MPAELHETSLIALLAIGFVLALLLGLAANMLRVSPIVGYLLAGIAVGPFTPGFVGDSSLASQLAEIGVILLMFGVGLHFSIKDLMAVRDIALPGAVAQIITATAIGFGMAHMLGWSLGSGPGVRPVACRWPAPWCCCARSRSATRCSPRKARSPWAGSSSKTWPWCWPW